jgi:hypothetical protein
MATGKPAAKKSAGKKAAPTGKGGAVKKAAHVASHATPATSLAQKAVSKGLQAGGKAAKATGAHILSKPQRLLLAEFVICILVLSAGTLVAPQGSSDGVPRLMTRGTGVCLLFLILSLASTGGPEATKVSAGIGGLVTVSYLVLSSDALNIAVWMTKFFGGQLAQAPNPSSQANPEAPAGSPEPAQPSQAAS